MKKGKISSLLILFFYLLLWALLAGLGRSSPFFPGPHQVVAQLGRMALDSAFYGRLFLSWARVLIGFSVGFFGGGLLAYGLKRRPGLACLIRPLIEGMKAVPIAVFTLFFLFFFSPGGLAFLIPLLVSLPLSYQNMETGLQSIDPKMEEMATVFQLPKKDYHRAIILPALAPYLALSLSVGLGMAWRASIAAEIIALVAQGIGAALLEAKLYLDMASLFAWTLVILLASAVSQRLALALFKGYLKRSAHPRTPVQEKEQDWVFSHAEGLVRLDQVGQSFQGKVLFSDWSLELQRGKTYLILGPSGSGKSTLARLLMGLAPVQEGTRIAQHDLRFAPAFQENRLIESWTVAENLLLIAPDRAGDLEEALSAVGLAGMADRRVEELSGGMKRRVAVIRAGLARGHILLLDEPFSALDPRSAQLTWQWIQEKAMPHFESTLLLLHREEDLPMIRKGQRADLYVKEWGERGKADREPSSAPDLIGRKKNESE